MTDLVHFALALLMTRYPDQCRCLSADASRLHTPDCLDSGAGDATLLQFMSTPFHPSRTASTCVAQTAIFGYFF